MKGSNRALQSDQAQRHELDEDPFMMWVVHRHALELMHASSHPRTDVMLALAHKPVKLG